MATREWLGGATAVQQVDHLTPGGTIEADDVFIVTLTAEDGTTQESISVPAGGTTAQDVVDAVHAAADAEVGLLFSALIWTKDSSKVIATAAAPGVPFYCTVETTETGGGTADDQTFVRSPSVANAGPNDWNTAANWSGATVPVGSDDVMIIDGANSILYGLNQSAVALASLVVGQGYSDRASIGTTAYALMIDAADVRLGGKCRLIHLDGTLDVIRVTRMPARTGIDNLILGGDLGDFWFIGSAASGRARVKAGATLDNVKVTPGSVVNLTLEDSIMGLATVDLLGGVVDCSSEIAALSLAGAARMNHREGNIDSLRLRGGWLNDRSGGTLDDAIVDDGELTFENSTAVAKTVAALTVNGGKFNEGKTLQNVTYSSDIVHNGGVVALATDTTVSVAR